jgi:hypothetical protein
VALAELFDPFTPSPITPGAKPSAHSRLQIRFVEFKSRSYGVKGDVVAQREGDNFVAMLLNIHGHASLPIG